MEVSKGHTRDFKGPLWRHSLGVAREAAALVVRLFRSRSPSSCVFVLL